MKNNTFTLIPNTVINLSNLINLCISAFILMTLYWCAKVIFRIIISCCNEIVGQYQIQPCVTACCCCCCCCSTFFTGVCPRLVCCWLLYRTAATAPVIQGNLLARAHTSLSTFFIPHVPRTTAHMTVYRKDAGSGIIIIITTFLFFKWLNFSVHMYCCDIFKIY